MLDFCLEGLYTHKQLQVSLMKLFTEKMITQAFKGGEFYAKKSCNHSAIFAAKEQNSPKEKQSFYLNNHVTLATAVLARCNQRLGVHLSPQKFLTVRMHSSL